MEVNEANLLSLSDTIRKAMSHVAAERKPAEDSLSAAESQANYSVLLISLIGMESADMQVRLSASIHLKNFVKRHWKVTEETDNKISEADRAAVKASIVDLMLRSPPQIQRQLSQSIAIIGQQDFPMNWDGLLQKMVHHFESGDFHIINGVLQTASSMFEKYSYEMKSQKLWTEIKFVLDNFATPFTKLTSATMELAKQHAADKNALKIIFGSLVHICKIFYYLNYQDLPEFFEDNIQTWMQYFHELLTSDNKLIDNGDEDEPGLLEELKSQICDSIGLYAHKYEEEFSPYMKQFVMAVWNLLLNVGAQTKFDLLASNAIQFLASVADRQQYKELFEDQSTLSSICEKIIVPNIKMREIDVEQFEDNPREYIGRDLEGSDVETRRRAACDLVKGLSRFFEPQITQIFGAYVKVMMDSYNADRNGNWANKDAAIYLVTSLASKAKTAKHGITQTNQLVDLVQFANEHIMPELAAAGSNPAAVNQLPVIKASCIKYMLTFRSQLGPALVKTSLPLLVTHLAAESHVVHSYSACAIEKILIMKSADGTNRALVASPELSGIAEQLLHNLFGCFGFPSSAENEYVMKCVMRSFSALQEAVIPYLATLLPILTKKLQEAAKNPTRPHYNHYLFESLGISIRVVCKSQPEAGSNFETVLFPVFEEILQQDVQEFVPYVFQILSLLLEINTNTKCVPDAYMKLFPFLLMPVLWERPGNITPLVRLIQAFISKGPSQIIAENKVEPLLGVFQKMIASKSNDHEGFYLLQAIVEHFPPSVVLHYIKPIFEILFTRLTRSKTTKFIKNFLVFIFLYTIRFNGSQLQEVIDSIQPNMFGMVCDRLIVNEVQKVSGTTEKKICAVGITKLLCETSCMVAGQYANYWLPVLTALVKLFELPEDDTIPDDEHFIEIEDTAGYQSAYSQLVFAGKKKMEPVRLGMVTDVRANLAQSLHKLSVGNPGVVSPLVGQLNPEVRNCLQKYMQAANVTIA